MLSLWVLFTPGSNVPTVSVNDKLVHVVLFAALGLTGRLAGVSPLWLAIGLASYTGVSEVLQASLPIQRSGDWRDGLADLAGVALGMGAAAALRRRRAA